VALHDHNEQDTSRRIIHAMCSGLDVALVSDAGTPLVSDPGYLLIGECFRQGLPVRPVPGASALICALSVCPLPTADFRFLGFLPTRSAARRSRLESLAGSGPLVFFEAPHRVAATLQDIDAVLPERRVFLGREMTKKFESYLCDHPAALAQRLETQNQYRGEFVCVLEGPATVESGVSLNTEQTMRVLAKELPPAQAARIGAELLGVNRRQLYDLLQARKDV
jgi:16S rRNA (cytidine1402-2'-O)-methyltransferase